MEPAIKTTQTDVYSSLGASETAKRIHQRTLFIRGLTRKTIQSFVDLGKALADQKADLRGEWMAWCEKEGITSKSANKWIALAERYGDRLEDLEGLNITGCYALIDQPEEVAEAALQQITATNGRVKVADVKEAIATATGNNFQSELEDAPKGASPGGRTYNEVKAMYAEHGIVFRAYRDARGSRLYAVEMTKKTATLRGLDEAYRYLPSAIDWQQACDRQKQQIGVAGGNVVPLIRPAIAEPEATKSTHPAGVIASAKTNEHPTPEWIWRPGLEMFGIDGYDLDPSSFTASPIPCKNIYTKADDGLQQHWKAKHVWSNFPYSARDEDDKLIQKYLGQWVSKLCQSYDNGNVEHALTLVKSDCRTEWFHELLEYASCYCFIKGGVKHVGSSGTSFFGSMLFYLGSEVDKFYHCYSSIGMIGQVLHPGMFGAD